MRFIKRLNLDSQNPMDKSWAIELDGRIVTDTDASIQIPAGDTTKRVEAFQNGQLRYNTDYQEFEGYINGQWEFLRTRRQGNIQFQTVGTGNYINSIYGPLSYRQNASKPENVFVFVENVYQVPTVNYTLVNDPVVQKATVGVTNPGVTILNIADQINIIVGQEITGDIAIAPGTSVVSLSTVTSSVVISGATLGTIQAGVSLNFAYSTGTFVSFTSAPPLKPIYALNGFDGYYPPFNQ